MEVTSLTTGRTADGFIERGEKGCANLGDDKEDIHPNKIFILDGTISNKKKDKSSRDQ